jgi:outer membrane protein assembly factor BamB
MHTPPQRPRRSEPLRAPAPALAIVAILAAAAWAQASVPTLSKTITEDEAAPPTAWKVFDAYPPELYDFDGDGWKELVLHNDNKRLYVVSLRHEKVVAELETTFPPGWGARTINGVAIERMQPGYPPSIMVTNSAAYLTRFDFDKDASTSTDFKFTKKWDRRFTDHTSNPGMDAKPVVIDANQNGKFETYVQVEEQGLFAVKHDGFLLWGKNQGGGNAEPVLADGDRDGHMEVYFFSDAGLVRVYDSLTGAFEWSYDAKDAIGWPASIPRGGTVAQVDGEGRWEVVFCARDAHDSVNYQNNHMGLFVVHNDDMDTWGNLRWMRQPAWAAPLCYTRPVVYDFNGNGKVEIYGMDWNTIGHHPGNWERTGPAHAFAFTRDGNELWHTTLETWWSNKDILIADFDGDATREVLVNGPNADGSHDGWWVLDIATGAKQHFLDVHPYKVSRAPRMADVDGDGDADLVMPVEGHGPGTTVGQGAFQVWDVETPVGRIAWSGGEDNYPKAAPFSAAFAPQGSSSTTHVAVKVTTFHHVTHAWFRENEGPWQALAKTSSGPDWGIWEADAEVPEGTQVRFKARDDLGVERVSGLVAWPPP